MQNTVRRTGKTMNKSFEVHMLKKTLDSYNVNRKFIDLSSDKWHGGEGNHDLLISIANCSDLAYACNAYLFHGGEDKGKRFIQAVYEKFAQDKGEIYLLYTNKFHRFQLSRVMQDLWVFPDKKTALKYLGQMKELAQQTRFTHLITLPNKVDFSQFNWVDQFIDPNLANDKLNFDAHRLRNQMVKEFHKTHLTRDVHHEHTPKMHTIVM